jgi:hypothetical protein
MKGKREKLEAPKQPAEPEKPEYHNNVYWKNPELLSTDALDSLLVDYE